MDNKKSAIIKNVRHQIRLQDIANRTAWLQRFPSFVYRQDGHELSYEIVVVERMPITIAEFGRICKRINEGGGSQMYLEKDVFYWAM